MFVWLWKYKCGLVGAKGWELSWWLQAKHWRSNSPRFCITLFFFYYCEVAPLLDDVSNHVNMHIRTTPLNKIKLSMPSTRSNGVKKLVLTILPCRTFRAAPTLCLQWQWVDHTWRKGNNCLAGYAIHGIYWMVEVVLELFSLAQWRKSAKLSKSMEAVGATC